MSYATTMLGRNVKHTVRNPVAVFNAVLFPIILLLMFVYVIGGAFDIGGNYIDYATPDLADTFGGPLQRHPVGGELWSSEHGPTGNDALNLLRPGASYGWPDIQGAAALPGRVASVT